MHKQDWVRLSYCHGHALQLVDSDTIKAIKIIRGSLDAGFELIKVNYFMFLKTLKLYINYSMFLKPYEKKSKILQKGKELPAG